MTIITLQWYVDHKGRRKSYRIPIYYHAVCNIAVEIAALAVKVSCYGYLLACMHYAFCWWDLCRSGSLLLDV